MQGIKISVRANKVISLLSRLSKQARPAMLDAVSIEGKGIEERAKALAPYDTKFLRTNITIVQKGLSLTATSKAPYSSFVIGKRYARGPHKGQAIPNYMEMAVKGSGKRIGIRLIKKLL